jgi:arylsulfatase A-like enzyme
MKALVLEVPALHLGYLGCYGSEWLPTPALDRLASGSVVFDRHYADCLGACRSPWTGRVAFPPPPAEAAADPGSRPDLGKLLTGQGIGVVEIAPAGQAMPGEEGTALERTLEAVVIALDELEEAAHWLLWAELPSLHPPWQVPDSFLQRCFTEVAQEIEEEEVEPPTPLPDPPMGLVDGTDFGLWERVQLTYAGVVSYLDAGLGLLLEELGRRSLCKDLLLVLTSQRGLALGEHGVLGDCRPWLHEELVHLPLLVRLPGEAEAGRRISALTQPVDLMPTLLEAFGLTPAQTQGYSLLPLMRGQAAKVRDQACSGWQTAGASEMALRTLDWALLLPLKEIPGDRPRSPQLYAKPEDRWEVNDVRQHHLDLAEQLEQVLHNVAVSESFAQRVASHE